MKAATLSNFGKGCPDCAKLSEVVARMENELSSLMKRLDKLESSTILKERAFSLRQFSLDLNLFLISEFIAGVDPSLKEIAQSLSKHRLKGFNLSLFTEIHRFLNSVRNSSTFSNRLPKFSHTISYLQLKNLQFVSSSLYSTYRFTPELVKYHKMLHDPQVGWFAHPKVPTPAIVSHDLNTAFIYFNNQRSDTTPLLRSPNYFYIPDALFEITKHYHLMMNHVKFSTYFNSLHVSRS